MKSAEGNLRACIVSKRIPVLQSFVYLGKRVDLAATTQSLYSSKQ